MSNTNYIYGDLQAAYNGGTIYSGGTALELIFAGAADKYQSVTHANLVSLVSTSALTEGSFYLINDYKTVYIQPDYSDENTPKTVTSGMTKEGVLEPLVVFATSDHTLSKDAWSTTFPNDKIEYDHTVQTLVAGVDTKGKITRRVDAVNNDISFDFRNVKFKRYAPSTEPFLGDATLYWDNSGATSEHYVFKLQDLQSDSYQNTITNNKIEYQVDWTFDNYLSVNATAFDIWAFNTTITIGDGFSNSHIKGYVINGEIISDEAASNNVFKGAFHNFIIGATRVLNNTFDGTLEKFRITNNCTNSIYKGIFREFVIDAESSTDYFQGNFYDFVISGVSQVSNNYFHCPSAQYFAVTGATFRDNHVESRSFGGQFGGKVIMNNFHENKIYSTTFRNNQITNFFGNSVNAASFQGNAGYQIAYCNFGHDLSFNFNTFSGTTPASVTLCDVKTTVASTNFTSSSLIYDTGVNKTIFRNLAESVRLSYFDENDALIVTDITD